MTLIKSVNGIKSYGYSDAIIAISIALCVFFHQYTIGIPGITLGEFLLVICSICLFWENKGIVIIHRAKLLVIYYIVALVSTILSISIAKTTYSMTSEFEVIARWIRYFVYIIFYVVVCDNYPKGELLLKTYKPICLIVSVYAIIQFLLFIVSGIYLPIDILPFSFERGNTLDKMISISDVSLRACGVFGEPGYLAKFILPALVYSLFGWDDNQKKDFVSAIIILLATMMSGSVQGIMLAMIVCCLSVLCSGKEITRHHVLTSLLLFVGLSIIIFVVYTRNWIDRPLERIYNLFLGESVDRSSQLRVYRGFSYWNQLPIEYKVLGVGMGNAANFAEAYQIQTPYDYYVRTEATLEYMSGISSILVTNGIICAGLFVSLIVKCKKILPLKGFIIILLFVIALFGGSSIFSLIGVMYFSLAFASVNGTGGERNGIYDRNA